MWNEDEKNEKTLEFFLSFSILRIIKSSNFITKTIFCGEELSFFHSLTSLPTVDHSWAFYNNKYSRSWRDEGSLCCTFFYLFLFFSFFILFYVFLIIFSIFFLLLRSSVRALFWVLNFNVTVFKRKSLEKSLSFFFFYTFQFYFSLSFSSLFFVLSLVAHDEAKQIWNFEIF